MENIEVHQREAGGGGGAKVHESSVLEKNVTVRKKLMF